MAVTVKAPISTAVMEDNPRCVCRGAFENGAAVIYLDARKQNHHEILQIGTHVKLH